MDEEQSNSPYAGSYGYSPSQPIGREVGSPVSSWSEIEGEAKLDREHQFDLMAIEVARKNGWKVKDARDLIAKKWEAQQSHKKADLEDQIKQATWDDDYGKMRQEIAQVNTKNLNAQERIDDIAQKYSYLAGANDEKIAKGYDLAVTSATKSHQSYRAGIQKYLPRGVGVDEVGTMEGEPDWTYVRQLGTANAQQLSDIREQRASKLAREKAQLEIEAYQKKQGIKLSPEAIAARVQEKVDTAKGVQPYKTAPNLFFTGGIVPQQGAGTPMATQPSTTPKPTPSATPSESPEATPSATPEATPIVRPKGGGRKATQEDAMWYKTNFPNATKQEVMDMAKEDGYVF
jgi:hypothetical protein